MCRVIPKHQVKTEVAGIYITNVSTGFEALFAGRLGLELTWEKRAKHQHFLQVATRVCSLSSTAIYAWLQNYTWIQKQRQTRTGRGGSTAFIFVCFRIAPKILVGFVNLSWEFCTFKPWHVDVP